MSELNTLRKFIPSFQFVLVCGITIHLLSYIGFMYCNSIKFDNYTLYIGMLFLFEIPFL